MKVEFQPIDARDGLCGYEPLAFVENNKAMLLGPINEVIHIRMKREYLTRLKALQNEIAAKYEPLFDRGDLSPHAHGDGPYGQSLDEAAFKAAEAAANMEFPGPEADYYT